MKFTIFVDPFLVIITIYLLCLFYAWEKGRTILKNNHLFSLYNLYVYGQAQEPLPRGHENYNFGRSVHGNHYYTLTCSFYGLCPGV